LGQLALLAAAYTATGYVGLLIPRYFGHLALIWLPAGISVYALVRGGLGLWPAIVVGSLLISLMTGGSLGRGLIMALFNTLGPVLTLLLLQRWRFDPEFKRTHDLLLLAGAGLTGMLVMAAGGVVTLSFAGSISARSWLYVGLTWWLSGSTGVLLLAPLLLSLRRHEFGFVTQRGKEFFIWSCLTFGLGVALFLYDNRWGQGALPLAFLVMPLTVWSAMRFGFFGMALGAFMVCGLAVLGVAIRLGPFTHPERSVELIQVTLFNFSVIVIGWLVVGLQRTRDQSEQSLRENRESMDLAAQGSTDGFWDWNVVTDELYFPERWLCKWGYTADDAARISTGAAWIALIHPEDVKRVMAEVKEHWATQKPYRVEFRIRAKDGSYRWALARGQTRWDAQGKPLRMAGSQTDITERLKEQERLRLLDICLSRSNDVIMICAAEPQDELGPRILYVNEAFTRVTGYSAEEAIGRSPRFLLCPTTSEEVRQRIRHALLKREALRIEIVNRHKSGEEIWFEVDMVPVLNPQGECTHFASIQREITNRKREEIELRRVEEQLRSAQRFETLGTLAGGVAHHFNNLLTGINGYIELAQGGLPPRHEAQEDLANALRGGQAAATLVRHILTYARRIPLAQHAPVDLVELVEETLPLLTLSVQGKAAFQKQLPSTPVLVRGDASHLQQALMNLALNGAQAINRDGGFVRVTVRSAQSGGPLPGASACLIVEDNGCGMDAELQTHIFDPFFTSKGPGEGTGLGLSVVDGIVASHGGKIVVKSSPGLGSTFEVHLPAALT